MRARARQLKVEVMHKQGDEIHINEREASGGRKTGHMRWVLGAGLALAVALLAILWATGSATQDEGDDRVNVTNSADTDSEDQGDNTDSIVSSNVETVDTTAADTAAEQTAAE